MTDQALTPQAASTVAPPRPRTRRDVVPVRHYGRGVFAALVVFVIATGIQGLVTNPNIEWSVVGDYIFDANVLRGLQKTLFMTLLGTVFSIVFAVVIAVMRLSKSWIISGVAAGYVFIFRGVPLIVLLIFVGNLGLFFKVFTVGIPFTDIVFWSRPARDVMTPFIASVAGLTLAGSGYMSEIVRGGLLAVGRGQHEAAKSVGLGSLRTIWHIILPQAMRVIVPPLGNEIIGMLKASAIVSVIAGGDLLTVVTGISGVNFRTIEMLMVATIWYLLVISVLSLVQFFLERRVAER